MLRHVPSTVAILRGESLGFELFTNQNYAHLSGRSEEDMIGKPFAEVFPDAGESRRLLKEAYRTREPEIVPDSPVRFDSLGATAS